MLQAAKRRDGPPHSRPMADPKSSKSGLCRKTDKLRRPLARIMCEFATTVSVVHKVKILHAPCHAPFRPSNGDPMPNEGARTALSPIV